MDTGIPQFLVDEQRAGALLLAALAEDVVFHHPLLIESVRGREHAIRFWAELDGLAGPVVFTHEFRGDGVSVLAWRATFKRIFQGVNIASWTNGRITELRQLLRPLPVVKPLRDALKARLVDRLPATLWELPPGIDKTPPPFDPDEIVDAKLPLPTTEDITFHSPVFSRHAAGEALVKRVIGHAAAIYGGRTYGPRLMAGPQALTQWAGRVAGLPIHAANLSTFDERGRMRELSLFMGPLPTVELFFDQLRPRLETFLDRSYFVEYE